MATPPLIETADCTQSGSDSSGTPFVVSYPNASAGDLLIFLIGTDGAGITDVSAPAGENSEVLTEIIDTLFKDTTNESGVKGWWTIATNSWTASTLSFTPSDATRFSAAVIRVPAGEFDATTSIGASGTVGSAASNELEADSPAFQAGATDGDGTLIWFCQVDQDPLLTLAADWTELVKQDIGNLSTGVAKRDAAVSNSENIASISWDISIDSWASLAFIVRAPAAAGGTHPTGNPLQIRSPLGGPI